MEKFYKITKAEADLIGKFEYEKNKTFDPFCSEQIDGTFIVSEKMYNILKDGKEFKKIDWSNKLSMEKTDLNTKPIE